MTFLPSDLAFNLIHNTLYPLFAHNYIVFAYASGLIFSLLYSLKHPSKYATLLIIGFGLLTFSFEYDKHIVEGLRQQTIQSLITEKPHYTVEKIVNIIIGDVMPILFYVSGWIFVFLAIFIRNPQDISSSSIPRVKQKH